ncbi:hypothetical protein SAMN04487939_103215 [Lysobacter sp. yr284]|nr:hypothetical protein SAMN04487939_103215 [Lysobacter sp. yr284]
MLRCMKVFARITQYNPVLLVCDSGALNLPPLSGKLPIQVTDACIAIRNATANGLPVRLLVSDEFVARPGELVCTRRLTTPNRAVVVTSVLLETFAAVVTRRTQSLVRVYANDPLVPDRIVVVVGEHMQP